MKQVFGEIEVVDGGVAGEIGFITPVMTERDYTKKAAGVDGIRGMIRFED